MDNQTFRYRYSAQRDQREIEEIRRKYLPEAADERPPHGLRGWLGRILKP